MPSPLRSVLNTVLTCSTATRPWACWTPAWPRRPWRRSPSRSWTCPTCRRCRRSPSRRQTWCHCRQISFFLRHYLKWITICPKHIFVVYLWALEASLLAVNLSNTRLPKIPYSSFDDRGRKLYNIDTWGQCYKTIPW